MKKLRKKKYNPVASRQAKERKLFHEYLERTPVIQIACAKVGISRATYYRWMKVSKEFRTKVNKCLKQGVEVVNDMAKSVVIKKIQGGDLGASKYWLSHHDPVFDSKRKEIPSEGKAPMIIRLDR